MPLPFQMADQFELLCVRPKETSLAAFQPFSASRPFQPQLNHDQHSFPPLNVLKGADFLLPTTRKRPRKKLKMIIITLGLLASLKNRYRADTETQLVEVRTRAAQAEARLDALKGKVAYTDVKAPSGGIVSAVHIKTIGAVVDAGAMMAEIVPDEKEVTVRAQVLTDDVAKIARDKRSGFHCRLMMFPAMGH